MSAVLRVYGKHFQVDDYLADCTLPICAVKRCGAPVFPKSQPHGRRHERSGVHITASDAKFDAFETQVTDSTAFLGTHLVELRRLCGFPGVESASLDFGIERRAVPVQCHSLPPKLLLAAGSLGIEIMMSYYTVDESLREPSSHGEEKQSRPD
ncbi:MAG: hypothetical protein QM811_21320 [Pirellulales bacterium]